MIRKSYEHLKDLRERDSFQLFTFLITFLSSFHYFPVCESCSSIFPHFLSFSPFFPWQPSSAPQWHLVTCSKKQGHVVLCWCTSPKHLLLVLGNPVPCHCSAQPLLQLYCSFTTNRISNVHQDSSKWKMLKLNVLSHSSFPRVTIFEEIFLIIPSLLLTHEASINKS